MTPDEHAIHQVHTTWVAAANAGDLEQLLALMTEDAVFMSPGRAALGRDGFPAGFLGGHQQFELRCTSALQELVVVGDFAFTRCQDALHLIPRTGGDASTLAGDRLTVYRRQPDGRWLLARDANTLAPS